MSTKDKAIDLANEKGDFVGFSGQGVSEETPSSVSKLPINLQDRFEIVGNWPDKFEVTGLEVKEICWETMDDNFANQLIKMGFTGLKRK